MYTPNLPTPVAVGLDIGATKWLATAVDTESWSEVSRASGFVSDDPLGSLTAITGWLASIAVEHQYYPAAVGCAFAGAVDAAGSVTAWPNRPSWVGAPVLSTLQVGCDVEVIIEDDGVCSALGEKSGSGVASSYTDFLCVCLGTGIGSALFLDGHVRNRRETESLSLGHFRIRGGRNCRCGSYGCLQTVISGAAFQALVPAGKHVSVAPGTLVDVTPLAELVADLARLLVLEAVIFTGGLLEHIPELRDALATETRYELRGAACDVLISSQPSRSALSGALVLAEQNLGVPNRR